LEKESSQDQLPIGFIDSLKAKIRDSEDALRKLKAEMRNTNPRYAELQYPQTISLGEAKEMLPDDNTILLEYSLGDSSSCLWVITRRDHKFFRLPPRKILQDQIESMRFALLDPDNSNIDFITGPGYSLYRQLVKPAEPYFTKKTRLIIVPDGILNYLPFEVLLSDSTARGSNASFSDLPFLVKKYPLSYAQSGTVLKNLIAQRNESAGTNADRKRIIALGDPLYNNKNVDESPGVYSFSRLENSGMEVEKIASYFDKGSADILLQDEASEDAFKGNGELKKYDYIHFATHGLIDENKPDFSSLVLTRNSSSTEDGFLRANEIFNLKLDADLVVLSACQTGLGKLIRGEGMVGLTRAFMYAGTPAVMVSLWSVSDISTATLMGEFYKNMLKGDLIKTDALRKAQLAVLKDEKFAHPFYWAPFVIFGDWR
jgi:CHAT domain-containing protein